MDYDLLFRYFSGQADPKEKKKIEEWLQASKANRDFYEDWSAIWKISSKAYTTNKPDAEKAWVEFSNRFNEKQKPILKLKRTYRMAAAILIFIMVGAGILSIVNRIIKPVQENYYSYESGADTLNILLEDGTRVTLNTNTILMVPEKFSADNRKVNIKGEAFFEVAHDQEHPFKVFSGNTITEVLGTSFNILNEESDVQVSLVSGRVYFCDQDNHQQGIYLLPGQHGIFSAKNNQFSKDTLSGMNRIAWKTGKLEFFETPITELCLVLKEYYHTEIKVDDACHEEKFTGIINDLSLEDALNIIGLTLDARITRSCDTMRFVPFREP